MRPAALIPALFLLVLAIVSPILARPGPSSIPELAVRDTVPLGARAPTPSLAARAPGPSARSVAKRALRQKPLTPEEALSRHLCPMPMRACPIDPQSAPTTLLEWIKEGFECVDPQEDLTSCGGCGAVDAKHDCTAIKGAQAVACIVGACRVDSCMQGYTRSLDGTTCVQTR